MRLGVLFWIPSGGLFVTLAGSTVLEEHSRRRKGHFRLSLSQSLTLYLTTALFAFPFMLSVIQYAPTYAVTEPEYLFYADALLAFFLTLRALYNEYRLKNVQRHVLSS
jgi:hypothetical protein